MALQNYSDLLNAINGSGAWLHRTDLAAIAPDWVTMCEATINYGDIEVLGVEGLRTADQETIETISTVANAPTVDLPDDFLEMRKVYYTFGGVKIELPQLPVIPIGMAEASNVAAPPKGYVIIGDEMYLFPIPDAIYQLTLTYYAKVGPLATQSTNWLMTKAPQVYLAGSVLHGSPWLGSKFNPAPWASMFKAGMNMIQRADVKLRNRLTTLRSERPFLRQSPFNILTGDTV